MNTINRRRRTFALLVPTILAGVAVAEGDVQVELDAKAWFNNPVFRLNDTRSVVLLIFDPDDRAVRRAVRDLNRLADRPDTVVIGLTTASRREAERFVRSARAEFTVGAESAFASKCAAKLPALYVLAADARKATAPVLPRRQELSDINGLLPRYDGWTTADLDQETNPEALLDCALSNADYGFRDYAIRRLFEVLPPKRFVEIAAEISATEPNPWVRGRIDYLTGKLHGVQVLDESARSEAAEYALQMEENPDDPGWAAYRSFAERAANKPVETLAAEYWERLDAGNPVDVVIRRDIVTRIRKRALAAPADAPERATARNELLAVMAGDPDHSIRLYAAVALGMICATGDAEAADALLAAARREPQLTNVRPTMEYAAFLIRTGNQNPDDLPPGGILRDGSDAARE